MKDITRSELIEVLYVRESYNKKVGLIEAERGAWWVAEGIAQFLAFVGGDTADIYPPQNQVVLSGMTPAKAAALFYLGDDEEVDEQEAQRGALILANRCIEWLTAYAAAIAEALPPKEDPKLKDGWKAELS